MHWKAAVPDKDELLFQDTAYQDELLGDGILVMADCDPLSPRSGAVEKSEPRIIDGQEGELGRGWYANGNRMYEEPWLNGKQHGMEIHWNDKGQRIEEKHWQNGFFQGSYKRW